MKASNTHATRIIAIIMPINIISNISTINNKLLETFTDCTININKKRKSKKRITIHYFMGKTNGLEVPGKLLMFYM